VIVKPAGEIWAASFLFCSDWRNTPGVFLALDVRRNSLKGIVSVRMDWLLFWTLSGKEMGRCPVDIGPALTGAETHRG